MRRRTLFNSSKLMDILLFDNNDNSFFEINAIDFNLLKYPENRYTIIGIKLIPKGYFDDKARYFSIKLASCQNPDEGSYNEVIPFSMTNDQALFEEFGINNLFPYINEPSTENFPEEQTRLGFFEAHISQECWFFHITDREFLVNLSPTLSQYLTIANPYQKDYYSINRNYSPNKSKEDAKSLVSHRNRSYFLCKEKNFFPFFQIFLVKKS